MFFYAYYSAVRLNLKHILVILLTTLAGCSPIPTSYLKMEYEGGISRSSGCEFSPNDEIRIPHNGIFITVRLNARMPPSFGVTYHIPTGISAKLDSDIAVLISNGANSEIKTEIQLIPYNQQLTGMAHSTDIMDDDEISHERWYGDDVGFAWFPFKAVTDEKIYGDEGTLTLPSMYIDGAYRFGPKIPYRKMKVVEIVLINC